MKPVSSLLLLFILTPCDHGVKGESKPVDLDAVAKAHKEAASLFTAAIDRIAISNPLDAPFDSSLPACRVRESRTVKIAAIPRELVGKRIHFGPSSKGDLWVVTKVKKLADATTGVLATGELATRLGVRCVPATVTVKSETEVDVVEE